MTDTKVLIVDDEPENIRYLRFILEENGFQQIRSAGNGEEGWEILQEFIPGLLVLDLRMPKKSGIHLFNQIKQDWKFKNIPTIILTGESEFLKHLEALRSFHEGREPDTEKPPQAIFEHFVAARPDAFLEKPIEPEAFMETVRNVLSKP
jgi:CheY-like chemotaxis protein